MSKPRRYTIWEGTLANEESILIERLANYVRCLEATASFLLGVDDDTPGRFEKGFGFANEGTFTKVRITNNSGAANTIRLGLGIGRLDDSRATFTSALSIAPNSAFTHSAVSVGPAATLIKAANSARKVLTVLNAGATDAFLGDSALTTATGFKLAPGASASFGNTAALYGICTAGTVDLRWIEET